MTNVRCVRTLTLPILNRQRTSLILTSLIDPTFQIKPLSTIPSPSQISEKEHLFRNNNTLSHQNHTADLSFFPTHLYKVLPFPTLDAKEATLDSIFTEESYQLWFQRLPNGKIHIPITLKSHSALTHFRAWTHAY